jgi:tRNA (guanine-N7-)-methyltransferase
LSRRKLDRFKHNQESENVIERGKPLYNKIKGKWKIDYFKNDRPITLELACGKGEYTVGLANVYPEKSFIGIDIKGDRIARGSKRAMDKGLSNVAFLRTGIQYLDEFFEPNEVSEIWLIHPDPQPRDREEKRRLTNQKFLDLYKIYLKNEGYFHLKTDSLFLFEYSLGILQSDPDFEIIDFTTDLYNSDLNELHHNIMTHYEKLFYAQGAKIHYIKCRLTKKPQN